MRIPSILAAAALVFSFRAAHADGGGPGLPPALECRGAACVYGEGGFCRLKDYSSIYLSKIDASSVTWGDDTGTVTGDEEDKVILDFSDGDQYSKFSFLKADVAGLAAGTLKSITGLYEDAFDWSDGYHTSGLYVVKCAQPKAGNSPPKQGASAAGRPRRHPRGDHDTKE